MCPCSLSGREHDSEKPLGSTRHHGSSLTPMLTITRLAMIALAVSAVPLTSAQAEWRECGAGKRVTCVVDGDTIWREGEKIRLMGFDTPEKGGLAKCKRERLLADKATARLRDLLNSGYVTVERKGKDRYRRTLAIVRVGGQSVGKTLIREGLAYAYKGGKRDRFRWCR